MQRSDFIKGIIGFFGVASLPKKMFKQYHRIYLLQSFVRGFRFYEGPNLLNEMQEGDMLELVREPDNKFDECAVALYFNKDKIGFIPQEDNEILSKLLDADMIKFQAEITHLQKEAKAWENVHIGVYVLKETNEPLPDTAKYLTMLETPHYRTLKLNKDKVAMVYYKDGYDEEIMDADDFYETMVENSKDNSVYDILHIDFESGQNLQEVINDGRMIVNTNSLPPDLKNDTLMNALEEGMITLDEHFDDNAYLVANVNRVANLSARIDKVVKISDKTGRLFYEIKFT